MKPFADSGRTALPSRLAEPEEIPRVRYLFASAPKQPPPHAELRVVTRSRPVERIVAALAWWNEGGVVKFLIAHPPGIGTREGARELVPPLEADPRLAGRQLEHGCLLAEDDELAGYLAERGYEARHTERVYEAPAAAVRERVEDMLSRYRAEIPCDWRTEPIRAHPPDVVWPLLAPYRLIDPDGLREAWSASGDQGYDPEFSCILFERGSPLGALLVRANAVCLAVDVRVVKPIAPRLRALANMTLFDHIARLATPGETTLRVLAFRARELDHGETSNLAKRMGGREVAVRHIHTRPGQGPA